MNESPGKGGARMLVLTRKKGQSIMLGDEIEISVVEVNGDAVRIGIKAPRELTIYRREIYEAIQEENIRASRAAAEMAAKLKNIRQPAAEKQDHFLGKGKNTTE